MLFYDSNFKHQHSRLCKLSKRWFCPCIVRKVFENGTYRLQEMDGTMVKNLIAEKIVKIFKKRQDSYPSPEYVVNTEEQGLRAAETSRDHNPLHVQEPLDSG